MAAFKIAATAAAAAVAAAPSVIPAEVSCALKDAMMLAGTASTAVKPVASVVATALNRVAPVRAPASCSSAAWVVRAPLLSMPEMAAKARP